MSARNLGTENRPLASVWITCGAIPPPDWYVTLALGTGLLFGPSTSPSRVEVCCCAAACVAQFSATPAASTTKKIHFISALRFHLLQLSLVPSTPAASVAAPHVSFQNLPSRTGDDSVGADLQVGQQERSPLLATASQTILPVMVALRNDFGISRRLVRLRSPRTQRRLLTRNTTRNADATLFHATHSRLPDPPGRGKSCPKNAAGRPGARRTRAGEHAGRQNVRGVSRRFPRGAGSLAAIARYALRLGGAHRMGDQGRQTGNRHISVTPSAVCKSLKIGR